MNNNPSPQRRAGRLAGAIRRPWVWRTAAIVGALFVLFGLFGYLALPGIIKSQAEKAVAATLHRKLSIERIDVHPYTLAVAIHGIKLYEPDGRSVFASLQELQVRVSAASLIHLAPVVKELHLVAPFVHLARTAPNRYSTDDIVAALAARPAAPASPGADRTARFAVYNIRVDGGRFEFDDQPVHAHHTVVDLKLGIPFVSSLPSQEDVFVEPHLSAVINGAPLLIGGKARPFEAVPDAVVDLNLDQVDLPGYLEYLPFAPRFRMPEAKLDLHLQASFQQPGNRPAAVTLAGKLTLKSLQLTTLGGDPILKLPQLVVELDKADLRGGRVDVSRVTATGLDLNVVKDAGGALNLELLAPASSARGSEAERASGQAPAAVAPEASAKGAGPAIQVRVGQIALQDAALHFTDRNPQRPVEASVEQFDLRVGQAEMGLAEKRVAIGQIESGGARFRVRQGRAETDRAPAAAPAPPPQAPTPAVRTQHEVPPPDSAGSGPWAVSVGRVSIGNWDARIESRGLPQLAVTTVTALALAADNLSSALNSAPARIDLKARVNRAGSLSVAGELGARPLHADLALDLKSVDLLALQPYVTEQVNVLVTQADLSVRGRLVLDQSPGGSLKGGFRGEATLAHLATIDKINAAEFLNWNSLHFAAVNAHLAPSSLDIDQIALSDFFARVIIDPSGRINLQDILRGNTGERRSVTAEQAPGVGEGSSSSPVPPAAGESGVRVPATAAGEPSAGVPIRIREVKLQAGRVRFTDNFIKPNYTANLLDLSGTVTGLSSAADTTAAVDVRGEVNSAPLIIAGQVNPIKGDLFLDLKASVHDMELAQLSPYSGKYVGYGIERGKLSFEVAYKLEHRQLSAENRLVLDQLTFGDRVDSPTATTLPVQLAVALLKDRNGVIDINLPIGGSLDDPQFSVGGVIVKVLVNLITKAITAPFALLGSLFGSGEELSFIEYAPGRAEVSSAGESRLKSLATALKERPGLKLGIGAWVDPAGDGQGLRHESLDRRIRAMKVKDLVAKGESATVATVAVSAEEYPKLLERLYTAERPPGAAAGAKQPPDPAEMEKLLLAATPIGEEQLKGLGDRRSQSVKTWLQTTGQIAEERLFLTATRVVTDTGAEPAGQPAPKSSRVEFSLK